MTLIRFAVQKSGRLRDNSLDIIKRLGVKIPHNKEMLRLESPNFPIEFLFLRDDDIPGYVEQGVADIGIVGENVLKETGAKVKIARRLDFSHCRLSIAVAQANPAKSLKDLEGKAIATSYPNILRKYAKKQEVNLDIRFISGSVEVAPGIKLADGIFDIVSTGSTLIQNGLKEIEVVMQSQAVLAASPNLNPEKQQILNNLLFRLDAILKAGDYKYIVMNVPKKVLPDVQKLLPGLKHPTITQLYDPEWYSVSTVVKESDFWTSLEKLKGAGAQDILVMPIEKLVI